MRNTFFKHSTHRELVRRDQASALQTLDCEIGTVAELQEKSCVLDLPRCPVMQDVSDPVPVVVGRDVQVVEDMTAWKQKGSCDAVSGRQGREGGKQ